LCRCAPDLARSLIFGGRHEPNPRCGRPARLPQCQEYEWSSRVATRLSRRADRFAS
jgi:hypothetical protein